MNITSDNTISIVVDVFRAMTTAAYVLDQDPELYCLSSSSSTLQKLSQTISNPFMIGKKENDDLQILYDIPNSPTKASLCNLKNRVVFHRSTAGAKGIVDVNDGSQVLGVSFPNAIATAKYLKTAQTANIIFKPMGYEGKKPSLEDDLCVQYILGLMEGPKINLDEHRQELKEHSGSYFFSTDQEQYPETDFDRCLEVGRFNFIMDAKVRDNHAVLNKIIF